VQKTELMKHILWFLIGLFSFIGFRAQPDPAQLLKDFNLATKKGVKATALNRIAVFYLNNNLDSARKYGKVMHDFAIGSKNSRWIARSLFYLGDIEERVNNISGQIYYLEQGQKVLAASKDSVALSRCYNRMARTYMQLNDTANALLNLNKFFIISSGIKDSLFPYAGPYNTLGEVYMLEKNYKKALYCFKIAAKKAIEVKQKGWIRDVVYLNTGRAYAALNKYDEALISYRKALKINLEQNDLNSILYSKSLIARLFVKMEKPVEAASLLSDAAALVRMVYDRRVLLEYYQAYIDLYEDQKDYKKKSEYVMLQSALNDSIKQRIFNASLADARTRFETNEKEKENLALIQKTQLQGLELRHKKLVLTVLVIIIFFFFLVAFLVIVQLRLRSRQKTLESEQKMLRSQMNPHFIFNSLTAIESYIYSNEPRIAGSYLSNFAKLMRLILENSREEYISLQQEIDTLTYYLELQKLRFDDGFDYAIHLGGNINAHHVLIPPMLAQPFIENSIEHGLRNIDSKGMLSINFWVENEHLLFEVVDNGRAENGGKTQRVKWYKSRATQITNERLKLFNKGKNNSVNVMVEEIKNEINEVMGRRVRFNIPYGRL
jgi:tetratricopeptide (TPR) repeat protein